MEKTEIVKMRYVLRKFDFDTMRFYVRETYELFPDGRIIRIIYQQGSRRIIDKCTVCKEPPEDFGKLCEELAECIKSADKIMDCIDNCSKELTIYYGSGKTEKYDRGYGNTDTCIGIILNHYIFK